MICKNTLFTLAFVCSMTCSAFGCSHLNPASTQCPNHCGFEGSTIHHNYQCFSNHKTFTLTEVPFAKQLYDDANCHSFKSNVTFSELPINSGKITPSEIKAIPASNISFVDAYYCSPTITKFCNSTDPCEAVQ